MPSGAETEAPKPKHPGGRPPMPFNADISAMICERIATEAVSLKAICAADDMPSMATVFKWLGMYPEFAKAYAHAREAQADLLFDETLEIADDSSKDIEQRKHFAGDDSSSQVNGEVVARSRLRIDTRKWMAGKLRPKKYGEKLDIDQKISADDPLLGLLGRIATSGKRLVDPEDDKGGE